MLSILNEMILEHKLDEYLSDEDKKRISSILFSIRTEYLYKSEFHGLHHSEKVLLFAYLLGKHEKLNNLEFEILLDAALYHDIGRETETEDTTHGYATALRINRVVGSKPIYQNPENLEILRAICDAHSVEDKRMQSILLDYNISEEKREMFFKLIRLLKDADALDRTRFQNLSHASLQTCFLRCDYSKELVSLAYDVNAYYRDKICERNFERLKASLPHEPTICLHGIGFNFPALDGILDYGILSDYAKKKKNLTRFRNFNGNNGEMWISVCVGSGEARKLFVDNGIYFECLSSHLVQGDANYSKARANCLPVDSDRYSDERFAFYEIQDIISINVNPELLNKDISSLNYLNGSDNFETLFNNVNMYLRYLKEKLNFISNTTKIEKIKLAFQNIVVNFEKLSQGEQKRTQTTFFNQLDALKEEINQEIGMMFKQAFSKILGKENIQVVDAITYILNSKKIAYQFDCGRFLLNQSVKRK